ncbi:hypothetical protein BKA69DRAFT_307279 [Paraphysoderma sedebokerense]|nr:hypothetical protein BKA69DRAFT_307279 [Paraphysoderma sedebokerense]
MLKCLNSTNSSPSYNSLQNYRISAGDFDHLSSNKCYSRYRTDITTSIQPLPPTSPPFSSSSSSSLESLTLSPSSSPESMNHISNSSGFLNVSGPYRPQTKQSSVPLGHASPHGRLGNPSNRNLPHHHPHLTSAGSRMQSNSSVPTTRHSMQRSPSLSPNITYGRSQQGSPQFLATNASSVPPLVTSPPLLKSPTGVSSGDQTVFDPFVNMISDLVLDDYTVGSSDLHKGYDGLKPGDLYSLSHSQMTTVNDNFKIQAQPSVQVIKAFLPLLHALCHARTKYHPPIRTPAIGPILKPYFSRGELPYKKLSHYLEHAESNGVVKLRRLGVNGDVEVWATSFVETTDIWLAVRSQYPIFKGEGDDSEECNGNGAVETTTMGSNSDRLSAESLARERCDSGISSIGSTQSAVSWSNFNSAAPTSTSFVRTTSPFVHPVNAMVSPLTTPTITFSLPPPFPTSPSSSMQFSLLPPPLQTSISVPSFGDLHRSNPRSPNVKLFPQHHNNQQSHSVQPIKRPPSYGSLDLNSPRDFHMHPQSTSFFASPGSSSSSALKPPTSNVPPSQHLMLPPQSRPAQSTSVPCLSSLWDPSSTFCTDGKNDGSDYSEFDSDDDGLFMNISRKNRANGGLQHKKQSSTQKKLEMSEAQNTVFSLWTSPTFNSTPHPEASTTNSGYNMWGSNGSSL